MGIVARSMDGVARLPHIASQAVDARQDSGRVIRYGREMGVEWPKVLCYGYE